MTGHYDAVTLQPVKPQIKVTVRDRYKTSVECVACPKWTAFLDPSYGPELGAAGQLAFEHVWHAHTRQSVDIELRYT